MVAGPEAQASDGVLAHPGQASGLAHAAALGNVGEDRDDFVLRQVRAEQGRAFAFGEATPAARAIEQPAVLRAVMSAHGEIAGAAFAVVAAVPVLAAEDREVVHNNSSWGSVQGGGRGAQLL